MTHQDTQVIRRAVHEDIESVLRISAQCALAPWSPEDLRSEIHREDSIFLVAQIPDQSVCGFILGRTLPGDDPDAPVAEIYNVGVSPVSRRSGIGSLLMKEFFDIAASRYVSKIFLEVRSSNSSAVEFYRKQGFQAYSTRSGFYTNPPDDATLMRATF